MSFINSLIVNEDLHFFYGKWILPTPWIICSLLVENSTQQQNQPNPSPPILSSFTCNGFIFPRGKLSDKKLYNGTVHKNYSDSANSIHWAHKREGKRYIKNFLSGAIMFGVCRSEHERWRWFCIDAGSWLHSREYRSSEELHTMRNPRDGYKEKWS